MNTKIPDIPQNWIIRRIRDIVRRKIAAIPGRKVCFDVKYAEPHHLAKRVGLRFGSVGRTIAAITLDDKTLEYEFGGRVKQITLPPIEDPKFNPDAIAECILAMYHEWYNLQTCVNLSHQVVLETFEALDGVKATEYSSLPSSLATIFI